MSHCRQLPSNPYSWPNNISKDRYTCCCFVRVHDVNVAIAILAFCYFRELSSISHGLKCRDGLEIIVVASHVRSRFACPRRSCLKPRRLAHLAVEDSNCNRFTTAGTRASACSRGSSPGRQTRSCLLKSPTRLIHRRRVQTVHLEFYQSVPISRGNNKAEEEMQVEHIRLTPRMMKALGVTTG